MMNLCSNLINMCETIINHPPNHNFYGWYKPFSNGWFMTLFYPQIRPFYSRIRFNGSNGSVQVLHCWVSWNIFPSLYTKVAAAVPQMMSFSCYPLVMTFTVCHGKIHHAIKFGKPSISMGQDPFQDM